MLEARNQRRRARGPEPVDMEAELRALLPSPASDPALEDDVRRLALARNARRSGRAASRSASRPR